MTSRTLAVPLGTDFLQVEEVVMAIAPHREAFGH